MQGLPRVFGAFLLSFVSLLGTGTPMRAADAAPEVRNLRETPTVLAVRKAEPTVVTIKAQRKSGYSTREAIGTGVIVDERGIAITNRHVVGGALGLKVVLFDGTELTPEVLVEDARNDIAILKLPVTKKLPAIRIASSKSVMKGETVIAIGNPFGYENTVSEGIVSGLNRDVTMAGNVQLTGLIQVTASINPGNSGGPLLNINGDLIGINVAVRDGANGIAFAINSDTVQSVLAQHVSAAHMSRVNHGLTCKTNVIDPHGLAKQQLVIEGADQDAVKRGDVLLAVGERTVANQFDLERSLWDYKAGDKVAARVVREGKVTQVVLTLSSGTASASDTTPRRGGATTGTPVSER